MTIKIFLTYTPECKITAQTFEEEIYFEQRKANGELVLEIPSQIHYKIHKIDMTTLQVVQKSPEEIDAEAPKPLEPPVIVLPPTITPTTPLPIGS